MARPLSCRLGILFSSQALLPFDVRARTQGQQLLQEVMRIAVGAIS